MKTKARISLALGLVLALIANHASVTLAQENSNLETATAQKVSEALAATFKKNYEAGDAAGIAGMFGETGEFIDSQQVVYTGPANIEAEFAALFEMTQDRKIELVIDSVRSVSKGVLIEDGHAWIQTGENAVTTVSQYTTVLVQQGNDWKIASLRDIKSEFASATDRLQVLDWMIGGWIDESEAGIAEYDFGWSEDGSYILGSYRIQDKEADDFTGTLRIGWCPVKKQFQSWTFDSEGGVAFGAWDSIPEGWIIKTTGTRSDGVAGSSTNYYERGEDGKIIWKSFDRHVGGEKQPDVEVVLVRKPPQPGALNDAGSPDDGE